MLNSPILLGNIDSLSILLWTHAIKCSIYSGAGILVGRLKLSESCQRYSNLSNQPRKLDRDGRTLLISGLHLWTRRWRAELCNGTVKKIDLVVEIDDCPKSVDSPGGCCVLFTVDG